MLEEFNLIHFFSTSQGSTYLILLTVVLIGIVVLVIYQTIAQKKRRQNICPQPSNDALYGEDSIHQMEKYAIRETPPEEVYRPIGSWLGRLVLPAKDQRIPGDGVLFEVYHTPPEYAALREHIVPLRWSQDAAVQAYVASVTQDIRFSQTAYEGQAAGMIHPERLNGWDKVGPLESLAGARPKDDVIVMLPEPVVIEDDSDQRRDSDRSGNLDSHLNTPLAHHRRSLVIAREPIQITGLFYGLVSITEPVEETSDRFRVRHFNPVSQDFDGPEAILRIPQVAADRHGITRSTNQQLERSPFNLTGWYVYGALDEHHEFVVQALEPRALMALAPDEIILGEAAGLEYIQQKNWGEDRTKKGSGKTVLIDPLAPTKPAALAQWKEGDEAILVHLYGGIGGEKKDERGFLGLVTGHFAYGVGEVVREPLSGQLRFDLEYQQIYAHNPDGILAGAIKWSSYTGDLQRGWLGNRPISDVLIKLDALTEAYDFNGARLSPLSEFLTQLQRMAACYRTGNGTGAAVATPTRSCVQDSNQALYAALQTLEAKVQSSLAIQTWLKAHPDHPQTARFQQLMTLGRSLKRELSPLGRVRRDWQQYAIALTHISPKEIKLYTVLRMLASWRTMLPRRAHDEVASLLLKQGAALWFIRTNQIGGVDPTILPLVPTKLIGNRPNCPTDRPTDRPTGCPID